ncbi:hypothetical protein Bbelb_267000 [Branchiostoma belcheri]|nr:hypothetical protein Bbelb_267000 [Branchiostoma belcheri]
MAPSGDYVAYDRVDPLVPIADSWRRASFCKAQGFDTPAHLIRRWLFSDVTGPETETVTGNHLNSQWCLNSSVMQGSDQAASFCALVPGNLQADPTVANGHFGGQWILSWDCSICLELNVLGPGGLAEEDYQNGHESTEATRPTRKEMDGGH